MTDTQQLPMSGVPVGIWAHGPLLRGVEDVIARWRRTGGVERLAVMPDVHMASEFCVGMVVASSEMLFPNAVGGDIGCGMLALRFDADGRDCLADADRAARMLGGLAELCPGRRHHRRLAHALPAELQGRLSDPRLEGHLLGEECRTQLGTLGSGNHFLEFQAEEDTGALWLMIHTGSRHLGQCVFHHHLPRARRLESGVMGIPAASPEGQAYLQDVAVARAWACENRRLLALRAADIADRLLGARAELETLYDCDHNHVALELLEGHPTYIHRKGATSAHLGEQGIVPGSMGTCSFHTVGQGCLAALASSSHGAGRAMSRTEARNRVTVGAFRQQVRGVWYDARIERFLREEAPTAYKPIEVVMRAQSELTTIRRRLKPLLVHKAV